MTVWRMAVRSGSALYARLSEINEHATFYSGVCVYVQQHTTGVFINNIQINVFLAEHRKPRKLVFGSSQG